MDEQLWNRVNIPFPSAVSSIRIPFSVATDLTVKNIITENDKLLKLLKSQVLQTEIRVLYELLYTLNNAFRQHKFFRVIKQVEQCINRLKEMKLDAALLDLSDLCPKKVQRKLAIQAGQCEVPSQPMLEWLSLKVLGASSLMSCVLNHCTRAFILTRQYLRRSEFIVLNVVLTGMVSRLWVFFQGVLASLVPLYQQVLLLLREVSQAQPMPSLGDFTLPLDMTHILRPTDYTSMRMVPPQIEKGSSVLVGLFKREIGEMEKEVVPQAKMLRRTGRMDFGETVSFQRISGSDVPKFDLKVLLKQAHGIVTEMSEKTEDLSSMETSVAFHKKKFLKEAKAAVSFSDMATHLEKMIHWCKCRRLLQEKGRLAFLRLRCLRIKHLEAEGYSFQRKLRSYKASVSWALSMKRAIPTTCQDPFTMRRSVHPKTRFQSLRTRFQTIKTEVRIHRKQSKRRRKRTSSHCVKNLLPLNEISAISECQEVCEVEKKEDTSSGRVDDIDDIFGSLDF